MDGHPSQEGFRALLRAVGSKLLLGPAKIDGSERELPLSTGLTKAVRERPKPARYHAPEG